MSRISLKQVIGRRQGAAALVAAVAEAVGTPISVEDAHGRLLLGEAIDSALGRHPIALEGEHLGWVAGGERAQIVASLLSHFASSDVERKALGAEVLHLYREVNLIYEFSEQLAALLDLHRVATLTLQQARHLIVATDGAVLLLDDATGVLSVLGGFGDVLPGVVAAGSDQSIIGSVVSRGIGEIVDDVDDDPRPNAALTGIQSVVCAPLKVGERVLGAIALGCSERVSYTAGDLKLLTTLALQAATAIENARLFERTVQAAQERERLMALHQAAEIARAKLDNEFALAARIQAELFPSVLPRFDGYDLAAHNRPARRCGGDYYDALPVNGPCDDVRLLLCVADVSGKGLPASLVMSNMQATLRALLGHVASLPELAARANDLLLASTSPEKYVTAALLELVPQTGVARFVSAGHVDNLLVRANGDLVPLTSTGTPLGLLGPGMPYDQADVVLEAGDCLLLYSDGVPDAQNEAGDEFGEGRLIEVARSAIGAPSDEVVSRILEAIDGFVGDAPQFDDITLMVVQRR